MKTKGKETVENKDKGSCTLKYIKTIRTGKIDANTANKDGLYPFFTCGEEILALKDSFSLEI
jgi:hypothetical protein